MQASEAACQWAVENLIKPGAHLPTADEAVCCPTLHVVRRTHDVNQPACRGIPGLCGMQQVSCLLPPPQICIQLMSDCSATSRRLSCSLLLADLRSHTVPLM